jgi:hypothetical protein
MRSHAGHLKPLRRMGRLERRRLSASIHQVWQEQRDLWESNQQGHDHDLAAEAVSNCRSRSPPRRC